MLKTGVKDGPCKGKSFYVCVEKQGCEFCQPARYVTITITSLNHVTFSFGLRSQKVFLSSAAFQHPTASNMKNPW